MTLTCRNSGSFSLTPATSYPTRRVDLVIERRPGEKIMREPATYLEIVDDRGINQRFTTHPRREVKNEHPLESAWELFVKPEWFEVERDLFREVLDTIREAGASRPLILIPRGVEPNIRDWKQRLEALGVEFASIRNAVDLNAFLIAGANRLALSGEAWLFLVSDGSPQPWLCERFDYLFVAR